MKKRFFVAHMIWATFLSLFAYTDANAVQNTIPSSANSIWFATEQSLTQLNSDSYQVVTNLLLKEKKLLQQMPKMAVWSH